MKNVKTNLLLLVILFTFSSCGAMKSWFFSDEAVNITLPFAIYQQSEEEIAYLTTELEKMFTVMNERDIAAVKSSYAALGEAIKYVETLQVNGSLSYTQASVLWDYMKYKYGKIQEIYDTYNSKMDIPVRLVYKNLRQVALINGAKVDKLVKDAEGGKFNVDIKELATMILLVGKQLAPFVAAL